MKIMITTKPIEATKLFSILNLIPLSPTCQTFFIYATVLHQHQVFMLHSMFANVEYYADYL